MASRKVLRDWQKDIIGRTCKNCGSGEDIEYHHIVPLGNGGQDVMENIIPLCHKCHRLAHGGRDLTELKRSKGTLRGGRRANCSDEIAFNALDELIAGRIGNAECKRRMKLSSRTEPRVTSQFKRWADLHGIRDVKTTYDVGATNSPLNMKTGYIVGWIYYNDGNKVPIRFSGCCTNNTEYTFRDASGVFREPNTLFSALFEYRIHMMEVANSIGDVAREVKNTDLRLELPFMEEQRRLRNATTA